MTGREVAGLLRTEGHAYGIRTSECFGTTGEGTGGWSVQVGRLNGRGPSLEVWADRWTGGRNRRFYAGIRASRATIDRTVEACPAPKPSRLGQQVVLAASGTDP
jgi:hypothetical protein